MFEKYFDQLAAYWDLKEFNRTLLSLALDSLQFQNEIREDCVVNNQPCYKMYSLKIENDSLVNIEYGITNNEGYRYKPDEQITGCNNLTWWTFVFDGKKLRFVRQMATE